jgi:hypothetical protein
MKIRLWGTEDECAMAVERLMLTPGFRVVSVSGARRDRGASELVRVYVEVRFLPLPHGQQGTRTARAEAVRPRALPS